MLVVTCIRALWLCMAISVSLTRYVIASNAVQSTPRPGSQWLVSMTVIYSD